MISSVAAIAFFALAGTASAVNATEIYSSTSGFLKYGSGMGAKVSQMSNVMAAQKALNACTNSSLVEDGKFGKNTTGVFKTFQASKGIKVDGIIGSDTAAKLAACSGGTVSTGSTSTVPGCVAGAMFSSTTGAACGTGTTSTTISGGAGNIQSIITLGSPSSTTVSEGDASKAVLGFEVRADSGSDLKVTNIGIKIAKTAGAGSTWVSRYINKVTIMQGTNVIGSIDASSLSQNGNEYTANVAVDNAIIKANMNAQFYVGVNGNTTIDTADSGSTLVATVTSVRYMDATGAVLTTSATNNQAFTFQKLSTNANVKLQVSEDNNNPKSRTVTSNYTTTTTDVSLLKFNVTANGSQMNINEIDVIATTNDTTLNEVTKAAQAFKLKYNGNVISSVNFAAGLAGSTARVVKFGETSTTNSAIYTATSLNGGSSLVIPAGQTASFEVLADVKPIASTGTTAAAFEAGDVLKVNLPSVILRNGTTVGAAVTATTSDAILTTGADGSATCTSATAACWTVLDQNGNTLSTSTVNRQGSATGYDATFRVQGLAGTLASSTTTNVSRNTTTGALTSLDVVMNINVTASGSDFFIPRAVGFATSASDTVIGSNGVLVAVLDNTYAYDAAGNMLTNASGSVNINPINGNASVDGLGRIKINAGQTAALQVTVTLQDASLTATKKAVQINTLGGSIDPVGTVVTYPTLPAASYQSVQTPAFS